MQHEYLWRSMTLQFTVHHTHRHKSKVTAATLIATQCVV